MVRKRGKKKQSYYQKSQVISKERHFRQLLFRAGKYSFLMTLLLLVGIGGWMERSGNVSALHSALTESFLALTSSVGLNLEVVYHDGLEHVSQEQLLARLPLAESDEQKVPIYAISLQQIKHDLEALGWIETVKVERRLPDALYVSVKERSPLAIWQHLGELRLIDRKGVVITQEAVEQFSRLPIIVGEDANSFFESLYVFMSEEEELMEQVASIIRIGGRRWNVRLRSGVEIKLPENNPDGAWRRLARLQREERILDREIKSVDLRIEDRMFISPLE